MTQPARPDPDAIAALFTGADGGFLCARWGRPVAPVVFGLDDATLSVFRAALIAPFAHAGQPLTDTDPETGANLMIFAVRDWAELDGIPDLDRLTGIPDLPGRLMAENAERYQLLRFDGAGAIRACLTFLRLGGALAQAHPAQLAESVAVNALLSWARPVTPSAPLAALIRAAYDPLLPACARDPSHALRLAARL
ncbi:hypothetical protein [Paracoccus alkenifer]|uniref:Uncharacterized protein n=1 Tax=Paracoccus alkenifer TaxID=65735 RepID=A0A1H6MK32_9RHOB|nr:hypothetical protein [Paracoccus alkenifer]SEH98825.1 hypothetical protein SAMN04488075_2104 [Paracoccus alkenifer]